MSTTRNWNCIVMAIGLWMAGGVAFAAPPVAVDDKAESSGWSLVIDPLANDSDADGDLLTVTYQGGTCAAAVAVDDGLLLFTPNHPRPQACLLQYQISDGQSTDSAIVEVLAIELSLFADGFESGTLSAWDGSF